VSAFKIADLVAMRCFRVVAVVTPRADDNAADIPADTSLVIAIDPLEENDNA
jgi:hypothetical protein